MWSRTTLRDRIDPACIGMIHLGALPGAPSHAGDLTSVIDAARADLDALVGGGLRAVMVENFHDVPFYPDRVPAETVAAMAVVIAELRRDAPQAALGVNVLRNDAAAALGIAAATGAAFIRVNVHAGGMLTDQGPLHGRAHRTLRLRRELGLEDVGILADLRVKHAAPLARRDVAAEARDLRGRALADAIIVSGEATGAATDPEDLAAVRLAVPDCPLLVGSGVTADRVADLLTHADGVIVGTSLKSNGCVDRARVQTLVAAARRGKDTP
jgi:membrane complex biogenesis BtpA family protein